MSQGTQSIDRAAQVLVHVVETDEAADGRRALDAPRASEEHDLAPRRCARAAGAHPARRRRAAQLMPGRCCCGTPAARRGTPSSSSSPRRRSTGSRRRAARRSTSASPSLDAVELLDQRDSRHFLGSTNWVGRACPRARLGDRQGLLRVRRPAGARPGRSSRSPRARSPTAPSSAATSTRIRARGYATAVDELEPGLWAVARSGARRVRRRRRRAQRLGPDRPAARRAARRARPPPRRDEALTLSPASATTT